MLRHANPLELLRSSVQWLRLCLLLVAFVCAPGAVTAQVLLSSTNCTSPGVLSLDALPSGDVIVYAACGSQGVLRLQEGGSTQLLAAPAADCPLAAAALKNATGPDLFLQCASAIRRLRLSDGRLQSVSTDSVQGYMQQSPYSGWLYWLEAWDNFGVTSPEQTPFGNIGIATPISAFASHGYIWFIVGGAVNRKQFDGIRPITAPYPNRVIVLDSDACYARAL